MTGEHYKSKKIVVLPGSKIIFIDAETNKEIMIKLHEDIVIKGGGLKQNFNIKGEILEERNLDGKE